MTKHQLVQLYVEVRRIELAYKMRPKASFLCELCIDNNCMLLYKVIQEIVKTPEYRRPIKILNWEIGVYAYEDPDYFPGPTLINMPQFRTIRFKLLHEIKQEIVKLHKKQINNEKDPIAAVPVTGNYRSKRTKLR